MERIAIMARSWTARLTANLVTVEEKVSAANVERQGHIFGQAGI